MPNVKPQARGLERRRLLVLAAMELFAQSGSRGTGVAAVAKKAGVTGATLLHHFGSKEGLLQAVLEARDERERDRWAGIIEPGGLETIRRLPQVATSWREDPGITRLHAVLLAESIETDSSMHHYFARRQSALRRGLRRAIEKGQAKGEIRTDVDARQTAIQIASFLDGIAVQWQLDPKRIPLERTFEHYSAQLVRELEADPSGR